MKLVKEILYEKFSEKGDPIKDMGIGTINFGKWYENDVAPTLKDWQKAVVESLIGKKVTGIMSIYDGDSVKDATAGGYEAWDGRKMTLTVKSVEVFHRTDDFAYDTYPILIIESVEPNYDKYVLDTYGKYTIT